MFNETGRFGSMNGLYRAFCLFIVRLVLLCFRLTEYSDQPWRYRLPRFLNSSSHTQATLEDPSQYYNREKATLLSVTEENFLSWQCLPVIQTLARVIGIIFPWRSVVKRPSSVSIYSARVYLNACSELCLWSILRKGALPTPSILLSSGSYNEGFREVIYLFQYLLAYLINDDVLPHLEWNNV